MEETHNNTVEYVGFWKRVIAHLVDTVLVALLMIPLGVAMVFVSDSGFQTSSSILADILAILFFAIIVIIFWKYKGATPGKMIISAVIVDAKTLQAPTLKQFIIRYLSYFLSLILLGLGFLWVAFDKKKQGLHDKLARTVVVKN